MPGSESVYYAVQGLVIASKDYLNAFWVDDREKDTSGYRKLAYRTAQLPCTGGWQD